MIDWLRHVFSAAFLYAQNDAPSHAWTFAHRIWLATLVLGVVLGLIWLRRTSGRANRTVRWATKASLAAAALLMAQFHTRGLLSARIWALSATVLLIALILSRWLVARPLSPLSEALLRAMACDLTPEGSSLPRRTAIGWIAAHGLGLMCIIGVDSAGWPLAPWALGISALLGLIVASWPQPNAPLRWRWEVWAPLGLAYMGCILRWLIGQGLGVEIAAYLAFPYPDPWSPWFDARITTLAACLWLTWSAATLFRRRRKSSGMGRRGLALILLGSALIWCGGLFLRHLSHGVSGSDPFCYLQMAVDLVERGTPQHLFPLARLAWDAGLPTWPVVPIGYHPPAIDQAATVWPPGWPALLAPLYALGGEDLALWGAPLWLALAAWWTFCLARELLPFKATLWAALAAAMILTSYEALTRAMVPMSDAAAMALSVAVSLCLWRARKRDAVPWSALAGLCWGAAYAVRHPQIGLGLMAIPALWSAPWPRRRRLAHALAYGGVALLSAIPDLVYHADAFGSLWKSESHEWFLLSWRNIAPTFRAMIGDGWLRRNEWGYLVPWLVYGGWRQARNPAERPETTLLWAGLAPVLGFHLCYSALRLRDLLPLFPWAALWSVRGMAALWKAANAQPWRLWARTAWALMLILCLLTRSIDTLGLPWAERVIIFGHVSAGQRMAYASLDASLPEKVVVATGLNAGAVARYTKALTVRPASWTESEYRRFAERLQAEGYILYWLDDGEEMELWCAQRPECARAQVLGDFSIPTFGLGGQDMGQPARLLRTDRPSEAR